MEVGDVADGLLVAEIGGNAGDEIGGFQAGGCSGRIGLHFGDDDPFDVRGVAEFGGGVRSEGFYFYSEFLDHFGGEGFAVREFA